jgi:hypothetical protein
MVYALNALIIFLVSTGFYNRAQAALRGRVAPKDNAPW